MQIEIEVAEETAAEVKFPCVTIANISGTALWFSNDIGFWSNGHPCHFSYSYVVDEAKSHTLAPKGTAATLTLKAEDGTEFPRVVELCNTPSERFLVFDSKKCVKIASDGTFSYKPGDISPSFLENRKPLPPGTITTIKIRDGEITATFEPPKDWLPVMISAHSGQPVVMERSNTDEGGLYICHLAKFGGSHFSKQQAREFAEHLLRFANEEQSNA